MPCGFGWLLRVTPEAASCASQLQHLLADPEMAALLAADPSMGRVLRPLCRMLAVEPPQALRLPKRARTPPPAKRLSLNASGMGVGWSRKDVIPTGCRDRVG